MTLSFIPSVPVQETWTFNTDVIKTRNGAESRLSLREFPRVSLDADFPVITQTERSKFSQYLINNINAIEVIPIWPYLSKLTADASSGGSAISFDVSRVPVVVGGKIAIVNDRTNDFQSYEVATVVSDGCTLTSVLTGDVTTAHYAILAMDSLIEGSGKNSIDTITQEYSMKFNSWVEPELQRPGSAASLTTYDSLPVLDKRPLDGKTEQIGILKEIFDNEIGMRDLISPHLHPNIVNSMSFEVRRQTVPEDFDFWRLFFATTRGGWKPFLHPTYMNDFNLTTPLVAAGTTIVAEENGFTDVLLGYEAFLRIEIEYSDKTISRHNITNVSVGAELTLTISPALPNDAKVSNVERISHLLKMRGADTVSLSHGSLSTTISFDAVTTDEG